ncbi:MAG: acyl carrier protein [Acutalibacteraceae bacterium]
MIKRIEEIYTEVTGHQGVKFTEDTRLDNEFNSLSLVQFICCIEDEFDIEVPNSAIKSIKTVGDAVRLIEKLENE